MTRKQTKKTPAAATSAGSTASKRIDKMIAELDDWRGETLAEVRTLIHDVDPDVVEEWKWMGSPTWSHDGVMVVGNAHKEKVKLTFAHGAKLKDPAKLFNATLGGGTWRAIDLQEGDRIRKTALKALVREALAFNTTRKGGSGSGKTVLLAGGNPQIAKADGNAPVKAYIQAMPGWKRDVGRRLDAIIERAVPNVQKAVRWNSPFYGVEGKGWFLSFHCFAKYVKVTFLHGSSLRPLPPVESKDPNTRYFHVHENEKLDEALFTRWVKQAAKQPGEQLF